MANAYFRFKQFTVHQDQCAMKVTTDSCLFGAWCAEEIKTEKQEAKSALDIGTGTGLLSLMIAQKNNLKIDALEIDEATARQANANIGASAWKENITVHCTDALNFKYLQPYDIIISNPPFYEREIESADERKNKAHHGHTLRLHDLAGLVKKGLTRNGTFYLLLPYKRIHEIENILKKHELFIVKELVVSQSLTHLPFRFLIKGSTVPADAIETNFLSIRDEQQQYTREFTELLKDYYLYL
jgi:tRNA1Val (adenine37-N6)-methyltransferase